MRLFCAALLLVSTTLMAQTSTTPKQAPPQPAAPPKFEFPAHHTRKLPNGLTLFVVEDHRLPLVSMTLDILAGGARDEPAKAGVAAMTAALLREGTATRSSEELARLIDDCGGALNASSDDDTTTVSGSFMKSFTDLGLELMADIVLHPKFEQEEIDRQMQQAQSGMQMQYSDVAYLANLVGSRVVFGQHPYGYPHEGTPQTLRRIQRDDLVAFHKTYYAPADSFLAIAGDITPEEALAKAEKYFGGWKTATPPALKLPAPAATSRRVVIVDMPSAVQTQIFVGQVALPRNHPDYVPLNIANQVFGGSFNSRLNMKLRANEGLTYGASSMMHPLRESGAWGVKTFTRTEKTAEAIKMILDLLAEWRANPASQAEFDEAREFMVGAFGLSTETSGAVAGRVVNAAVFGLPGDYWATYRQLLESQTRDKVAAAVQKHIKPDLEAIVAVGDAKGFAKALENFGPVTIIPAGDLDVIAPGLRKPKEAPSAPPEDNAKAKQIVNAAIEAAGGLEALSKIKDLSSKSSMKMSTPQGEMPAEASEEVLYPDRYRITIKLPVGEVTHAFDGQTGWMSQGAMVRELPPGMGREFAKGAIVASGVGLLLAAGEGKASLSLIPPDEADGNRLDGVLWKQGDNEMKVYFDPDTKLLSKVTYNTVSNTGPVETDSLFSDYREMQGVKLPFKEVIRQNGVTVGERIITERKINGGLPPSRFQKP